MPIQKNNIKTIFIIAGELSGDQIGAGLMYQIKKLYKDQIKFIGVGGDKMKDVGLEPIFDMSKISVMGIFEIFSKIIQLMKLINYTKKSIIKNKPSILITIDSPGFNLRIHKKVANIKCLQRVHYVVPSVWAWKAYRAKEMAKYLDLLLVLFPFEKKYFRSEGLDTHFVGHPIVSKLVKYKKSNLSKNHKLDTKDIKLLLLPGSRMGEIKRLFPIFVDTAKELTIYFKNIKFYIVTPPNHKEYISNLLSRSRLDYYLTDDTKEKYEIFSKSDFALCASGTVSLELACFSTPMIVTYKMNWLTWILVKFMISVKTATLLNIILNKNIIPEFFQSEVSSVNLSAKVKQLLLNNELRYEQIKNMNIAIKNVISSSKDPNYLAAKAILKKI